MTDISYPEAIQEYGNHVRLITEAWNSRNNVKPSTLIVIQKTPCGVTNL